MPLSHVGCDDAGGPLNTEGPRDTVTSLVRHMQPAASWAEIAQELGITERQAQRLATRALAQLREWLEQEGYSREDFAALFG